MAQVFNAIAEGLVTSVELDEAFAHFLESPGWRELQTRTARRMCDGSYTFEGDRFRAPPAHLQFSQNLIQKLMPSCSRTIDHLQSQNPNCEVIPLQVFLCLYEDGEDRERGMGRDAWGMQHWWLDVAVEGRRMLMRHGDVLILDGERHGVPALQERTSQSRVSVNIFFTTSNDASRPVSVNHRAGAGYQILGHEHFGHGQFWTDQTGGMSTLRPSLLVWKEF
eukprot:g33552.t1